jgi:hypothetical protein
MDAPQTAAIDSAGELRAEVARRMVPIYHLSSKVGLHPAHLGQVLRGRRPLSPELEGRIRAALSESARDRPASNVAA